MKALRIPCKTARFNLSKVRDPFFNLYSFGEEFADWLRTKLIEKSFQVRQPYEKDWGWELQAYDGKDLYCLSLSDTADDSRENEHWNEWCIVIEKKCSIGQRLRGKGNIAATDKIV